MAKLDFSSLKTADLRSVAPVDESAIPRAQQLSEAESAVSPSVRSEPVSAPAPSAPSASAHPVQSVAVSTPAAPVTKTPAHSAPASKKISLTGLKTGGVSLSSTSAVAPAPVSEPAPAAVEIPKPVAHSGAPKRAGAMISLGTKPAISLGKKEESEVPATSEVETVDEAPIAQVSEEPGRPLVEGVDIIQAAKVIGTEGESLANEILTESLKDPEAAKKEAEEKAVAAVVIPESSKEFFPNLEMDDDFFKDPLFEGIVPPKPDKKPEVRLPIEMKKEEPEAVAVAEVSEPAEAAVEPVSEIVTAEEATPAVAEEATAEETAAPSEAVLDIPAEAAVELPAVEAEKEAYVEAVAKDLSAERKGGLSKLFGERKVLVRAMAGFFALAVVGVGAFSFVSPSIKTSGPESTIPGTGSETPSPFPKYVPEGETKIVGEGVRVFTGRRPNGHKRKNVAPVANTGTLSASGSAASPISETGGVQPHASPFPSGLPVVPASQPSPTEMPTTPAPASE